MKKKLLFGIFLFVSWSVYGMEGTESPSPEPQATLPEQSDRLIRCVLEANIAWDLKNIATCEEQKKSAFKNEETLPLFNHLKKRDAKERLTFYCALHRRICLHKS